MADRNELTEARVKYLIDQYICHLEGRPFELSLDKITTDIRAGRRRAVILLKPYLAVDSAKTRIAAVSSLAVLGKPALKRLSKVMQDSDPQVRLAAVKVSA